MSMTYEQILAGRIQLAGVNFAADVPYQLSRGNHFFRRCDQAGLAPATHMNDINLRWHNFLEGQGWIWSGVGVGNTYHAGAKVLDNTLNASECAAPAQALRLLINAPRPWGWGDGGAQVVSWSGIHHQGFICLHAGHLPGPEPNIIQPNGQPLAGYYLWGDHKVVEYNGAYYDPNYGRVYAALPDMAVASLQLVRARVRLRDLREYDSHTLRGAMKLVGLKIQDLFYHNVNHINVYHVGSADPLTGYYIAWERTAQGLESGWSGPHAHNPLVR